MTDLLIQLDDLPDEILTYIFKKLYNYEVLYSLMGVNQRINRITHDRIFTRHLRLLEYCRIDDSSFPLSDPILDRFCSTILPTIGHQIETVCLEGTSMERVLHATNYLNLHNLGLCDIDDKLTRSFFSDTNPLIHVFNNQISSLFINFLNKENDPFSKSIIYAFIFTKIWTIFTNLRCLDFNSSSSFRDGVFISIILPETAISSTLLELHVDVRNMMDCLEILDERFDQLRILYINIYHIETSTFNKERNEKLLPNLRIFSLCCNDEILLGAFNESIVPLLRRMIHLEELDLNITVQHCEKFIDGDILKKDIMVHMPHLYKFTFNIYSTITYHYQTNFPLNEYIEKTFKSFSNNQITTCIDHWESYSQCHIYSHPYHWKIYHHITNNFPDGLFNSVTQILLFDEHPFEYEFFLRISRSFPFMKQLTIVNRKAQQIKSNNDNQILSIIEYSNLIRLDLSYVHDDYVELFLFNMKMSLPNNLHLRVHYKSLERVTRCFTRYMTENKRTKIAALLFSPMDQIDEYHIKNYFPYTCIHRTYSFILSK
ncbi:unnamed protein product [Adineta steineri]|uniref:F-box domain-containing protein n=2 Tax=Adineta steineri TaxID=433720 RepID=A0A815QVF9_9BILA|nr:unnamed protein product [Adineta steineri]CAF4141557.1 unnamed protein product [Adineta steineri]